MTVEENIELGGFLVGRGDRRRRIDKVMQLFPRLAERRRQFAGTMSGGEQQMLAIGRALVSAPRLLMLDEPSLGWRRRSSPNCSRSSATSTRRERPFCWSSRMSARRCGSPATATCWSGDRSRPKARANACCSRTLSGSPIWARSDGARTIGKYFTIEKLDLALYTSAKSTGGKNNATGPDAGRQCLSDRLCGARYPRVGPLLQGEARRAELPGQGGHPGPGADLSRQARRFPPQHRLRLCRRRADRADPDRSPARAPIPNFSNKIRRAASITSASCPTTTMPALPT